MRILPNAYLVYASGVRHRIPAGGDFLCFTEYRHIEVINLATDQIASITDDAAAATCAPDIGARVGKIMRRASDGATWIVGGDHKRHWIQDTQTYYALIDAGAPLVDGFSFDGVNLVPEGAFQPRALSPARYANTIIRRADGVAWVVDATGVRHWIPDGYSSECYRERGYRVAESNLVFEQAASLPEGGLMGYCLARWQARNTIIREASTGTSYFVDGNVNRRWIPDGWTFEQIQSWGIPVLKMGLNWEHISSLTEVGWMPYGLPVWRFRGTLIHRADGAVYVVDANGVRHWVRDWYTVERLQELGYGFAGWNLNGEQVASLGEGGWQPLMLARWRVRNHVARAADGTAYFITSDNRWHWIPNSDVYWWLVRRYGLAGTWSWEAINSIRWEGGWAGYW